MSGFCTCPEPRETLNPRKAGSCVKCGKQFDPAWLSTDANVIEFFNDLTDARNLPTSVEGFRVQCEQRELAGRDTFGLEFLARDNCDAGTEEGADLGLYAYLETLRAKRMGIKDGRELALMAAFHACWAHHFLLRYQEVLDKYA